MHNQETSFLFEVSQFTHSKSKQRRMGREPQYVMSYNVIMSTLRDPLT